MANNCRMREETAALAAPRTDVQAVLDERGKRYGKFSKHADITQGLKIMMHQDEGWGQLTFDKREALDMIAHKIGRILNGDPEYKDSWVDIAGYATLVANELKG